MTAVLDKSAELIHRHREIGPRFSRESNPRSAREKLTSYRVILLSAAITLAICPILSWICPPAPYTPDEFSYLLAADTFAHARLTNPTHPLWVYLEAPQITHVPSYQSRYPPGQGLFLAAGQVLTGHPIAGVWLSMAAAAAAVCWMLLAWTPPRWALLGSLLPVTRFGTLPLWEEAHYSYWATSFLGGAVAMGGGALLFGALARMARKPSRRAAAAFAVGLVVLANTRPYEGLVAAICAGVVLTTQWRRLTWRPIACTALAILLPCFGLMGYYNWRLTSHPIKMPYLAHSEQYEITPLFVFQQVRFGKTYNHYSIDRYHQGFMVSGYDQKRSGFGLTLEYLALPLKFFWGPLLSLAAGLALMPPWDRWAWFGAVAIALSVLASAVTVSNILRPHYLAPVAPLFVYLAVAGLRRMRALKWSGRFGRPLSEAVSAFCLLSFGLAAIVRYVQGPAIQSPLAIHRPVIIKQLGLLGGKHLILVRFSWGSQQWVYNGAEIDTAPIVWANDMGEKNDKLLRYYSDRTVWLLQTEEGVPRLEPYRHGVPHPIKAAATSGTTRAP